MVRLFSSLFAVALVLGLSLSVVADDTKKDVPAEKEYKGQVCCAKCELKIAGQTKCATVVVVKEKVEGKEEDVVYWFDAKADKKYHGEICTSPKEGKVYGKVETKDKKKILTVTKVEY